MRAQNWIRLFDAIEGVISTTMAKHIKSEFLCQYSAIAGNIKKIACDCGDVPGTGCFDLVEFLPIGETDLFSGLAARNDWGGVRVSSRTDTVAPEDDIAPVSVAILPDLSSLIDTSNLAKKGMDERGEPIYNQWEVVTNSRDVVVGQLIGTGVQISVGNISNPIQLCIDRDFDILLNNDTYAEPDLATLVGTDEGPNWTPLGDTSATFDGVRVCADILEDGIYFPIYRILIWESQNETLPMDECGVVGGDNSTCADCNGVPNGPGLADACGVCDGDNTTCCHGYPTCSGQGTCNSVTGVCACNEGYIGQGCQLPEDPCTGMDCSCRGTCVQAGEVAYCACQVGFAHTRVTLLTTTTSLLVGWILRRKLRV